MSKKSTIQGLDKLIKQIKELGADFESEAQEPLKVAMMGIHGQAIKSIQANGSQGAPRSNGKGFHSKPGEPPNTDTGRLVSSIKFEFIEPGTALVGTNLKYGAWLEFGTQNVAARPWLAPAFLAWTPWLTKELTKVANKIIRKAGKK